MSEIRENLRKVVAGAACLAEREEAVIAVEQRPFQKRGNRNTISRGNQFMYGSMKTVLLILVAIIGFGFAANSQIKTNTKEKTPQETVIQNETITEQTSESTDVGTQSDNDAIKYTFLALMVVLLIAYVVAIVKTRKGLMYTFANWWDFIILMIAALCLSISLLNIFGGEATTTQWIIFSVGIVAFSGSLFMSIKINQGNGLNIAISICAKLFVFVIIALIIVIWIAGEIWRSVNKDALTNPNSTSSVYSDLKGIEQGEKMKKAAGGMAGFLLVSLIALKWKMPHPIAK